jgi:hypothetical protein
MPIPVIYITSNPKVIPKDPAIQPADCVFIDQSEAIGVDTIRSLQTFLKTGPLVSPAKLIVIYQAGRLTPVAQNALLKLLEEPPAYAQILLQVPLIDQLLPTLVSRCRLVYPRSSSVDTFQPAPENVRLLNTPDLYNRLAALGPYLKNRETAEAFLTGALLSLNSAFRQKPNSALACRLKALVSAHDRLQKNAHTALTLENLALHW